MKDLFRLASVLALTAVAAAESPAPSTAPSVEPAPAIPLKWTQGLMTLPVEIAAKKGNLMVDTGAAATSLRDTTAKELNVTLKADENAKGAGIAGTFDKVMTGEVAITVPGQKPDSFPTLARSRSFPFIPLAAVEGMDSEFGVIGMKELSEAGAVIDCLNGTMELHPSADFHSPKGFQELPMTRRLIGTNASDDLGFLWTLPVRIHGKDGLMVVDTGASRTVLDESFAKQAGVDLQASDTAAVGAGHSTQSLTEGTAPDVILGGGIKLGSIPVSGSDLSIIRLNTRSGGDDATPFAGILGMDQLIRVRAIFDCKRGVLHSASETLDAPLEPALIIEAITALVEKGDQQAIQLQDDAVKNNGALSIDPLQGSEIILRAIAKGLIDGKAHATPDALGDVVTAIQKLAEAGDEEANKCVADAAANNGQLKLTPQQAEQLVARAREKGLLGK